MAKTKIRIADGTPPFNVVVKDRSNNTVYNTSSNSDEVEVPDGIAAGLNSTGLVVNVTDVNNNSSSFEYDPVTFKIIQTYWVGHSVSNGDTNNHLTELDACDPLGFNYLGVLWGTNQFLTDAQFDAFDNAGPFDHTQPEPASPQFPFDKVVSRAYHKTNCRHLRVGIWLGKDHDKLNNGSTLTKMFSMSDSMMRPDGSTPVQRVDPDSPIASWIIPSYAVANGLEYGKRVALAFFKRYYPAINDGTIAFVGLIVGSSGEAEYPVFYHKGGITETENGLPYSAGDFHPESIAKFKAKFPEYASASNADLAWTGGLMRLKFRWHLMDEMAKYEKIVADHIHTQLGSNLTRTKWMQVDVGSFVDELAPHRQTAGGTQRINNRTLLMKSNDNCIRSDNALNFIIDHVSSLARKAGGVAIVEPSPSAPWNDPISRDAIVREMQLAYQGGRAGISFFDNQSRGNILDLYNRSGIVVGSVPGYKAEFKDIGGGNKQLDRHTINLSSIMNDQFGVYQPSWQNFKDSNGLAYVDTQTIDDLKP